MSRRRIKRKSAQGKTTENRPVSPGGYLRVQQAMRKNRERAMDNEAVSRYIYNKEFDMEYRYDEDYRVKWAKKANMGRSRFNAALDRVIAKAWERIRKGNTVTDTETAAADTAAASTADTDAAAAAADTDTDDTCEAR